MIPTSTPHRHSLRILQGHDTTSSGVGFTIHLLGAHPDIQKQCQAELDDIMGNYQPEKSVSFGQNAVAIIMTNTQL